MFSVHIKSPFIFINTRLWKTKPGTDNLGMSEWHNDGFSPGFRKIMVYLTPCDKDFGSFKYICPKSRLIREIETEDGGGGGEYGGQVIYFSNSDIEHTGITGTSYERISIELTIFRSTQSLQQEWQGHFWGRDLKSIKQLNSLTMLNNF